MHIHAIFFLLFFLVAVKGVCLGGDLSSPDSVRFEDAHGNVLQESKDLSAVALVGKYLVIGSDEGHVIQVLQQKGRDSFELVRMYSIPDGREPKETDKKKPELDIEGIAANGDEVYIIGSHSRKRKKVAFGDSENDRSYDENRDRLRETHPEKERRVLFRVFLNEDGKIVEEIESSDLWGAINKFDELEHFKDIPSKENGIDIEGIAAGGDRLYIGFRGPVLTGNWVPVLVTEFAEPCKNAELRFVNLGGLGIRDMVAVDDGRFLLIAGPVGDGPGGYHLYSWNGLDCVPDVAGTDGVVQYLGEIPADPDAKAEGITILPSDRDDVIKLLILFDGPKGGKPVTLNLRR